MSAARRRVSLPALAMSAHRDGEKAAALLETSPPRRVPVPAATATATDVARGTVTGAAAARVRVEMALAAMWRARGRPGACGECHASRCAGPTEGARRPEASAGA